MDCNIIDLSDPSGWPEELNLNVLIPEEVFEKLVVFDFIVAELSLLLVKVRYNLPSLALIDVSKDPIGVEDWKDFELSK